MTIYPGKAATNLFFRGKLFKKKTSTGRCFGISLLAVHTSKKHKNKKNSFWLTKKRNFLLLLLSKCSRFLRLSPGQSSSAVCGRFNGSVKEDGGRGSQNKTEGWIFTHISQHGLLTSRCIIQKVRFTNEKRLQTNQRWRTNYHWSVLIFDLRYKLHKKKL